MRKRSVVSKDIYLKNYNSYRLAIETPLRDRSQDSSAIEELTVLYMRSLSRDINLSEKLSKVGCIDRLRECIGAFYTSRTSTRSIDYRDLPFSPPTLVVSSPSRVPAVVFGIPHLVALLRHRELIPEVDRARARARSISHR